VSGLPSGWAKVSLGELGIWGSGGTPKRSNALFYSNGTIPWLVIGDLNGAVVTEAKTYITEEGFRNSSAKILPPGTLLIAMYGSIGKLGITGIECATNQAIAFCIPNQEIVNLRYLFHVLGYSKENLLSQGKGVAQQNISQATLKAHQIPLAPLKEQDQIAERLDALIEEVTACRELLDRVSHTLKQFRKSTITDAVSGKLTQDWREVMLGIEQSDFNNTVLPHSWEWRSVREVGRVQLGRQRAPKYHFGHHMRPYLRVQNIFEDRIDLSDVMEMDFPPEDFEKYQLAYGDILLNEGQSPEFLGRPAMYRDNLPGACFTNTLIRFRAFDIVDRDFALLVFRHYMHSGRFSQECKITTNIGHLSAGRFSTIEFPLPSLGEQQEIVSRTKRLLEYADDLETNCQRVTQKIEQFSANLVTAAFCGRLAKQNPSDETVSVLLKRIKIEKNRMESEQNVIRSNQRSTKKTGSSKVPVQRKLDYSDALSAAFRDLGSQGDARQLFDQAGFIPAEVIQFYEALRRLPEVRDAFKGLLQDHSYRERKSVNKNTDDSTLRRGRFRLSELWLEEFKNLTNYTIRFDSSHSIDIVLGWNGTGKSNLFEALVIIFRDLHRWSEKNNWPQQPMKGYRLRYEINNQIVDVSWQPREMKRPKVMIEELLGGGEMPSKPKNITRDQLPLPRFIFGYYSGPTNRLSEHFLPMKQEHYDRLRTETSDDPESLASLIEKRRFFCAENHHAKYVLLAFFHKEDAKITCFLEDRLRIIGFESALFIIRKPRWAKKGQTAEDFWGATGIMRRVMERLRRYAIAPMVIEQTVPDGFRSNKEDHYYFFLPDLQSLHAFAAEYQDARTFFLALESTDFSELIYDVKVQVRVKATHTEEVAITFHELSEGEQQLLMVLGLMRFTKSHQSLVLLDEPDTHLNPHWSVDYLKLLARVMSEEAGDAEEQQTSQILMSTHDPLVIASLFKEQIHLLKRDWQTGICKWEQPDVDPRGLGFTGILTSEMFGMRSDLDEETLADLDAKVRLFAQDGSLTPEEATELEEINKRLEDAGFQKAFSDPYYAAFVRAWSRRHSDLMTGVQFLSPEQQEEIDRISREVLEEAIAELQAEAIS
jgi:restriction endonuclease S subunit/predicted ATPase